MRGYTRSRFRRSLRHRLTVAGTFFAYLLATLHLPLPASVHKDGGVPFPCQNHPCGCQTAEQCWRNCCCFTPEERWAWAREHNVEPPAYAEKPSEPEKPTEQGWNTVKLRDRSEGESKRPAKSCCSTQQTRLTCCQPRSDQPVKHAPSKSGTVCWVSVMAAWQCQGLPTVWLSVAVALPISLPEPWSPDPTPPSRVPLTNVSAPEMSLSPPAPPPRSSVV